MTVTDKLRRMLDGDYMTALTTEFVRVLEERDTLRAKFEVSQGMRHDEHERHVKENAKMRELVERLFGRLLELLDENDKLREMLDDGVGRSNDGVAERGTCHDVWDTEHMGRLRFQCSECGGVSLEITPRFCPMCGRKVVDE